MTVVSAVLVPLCGHTQTQTHKTQTQIHRHRYTRHRQTDTDECKYISATLVGVSNNANITTFSPFYSLLTKQSILTACFVVVILDKLSTAVHLRHEFKVGIVFLTKLLQQSYVLFLHVFKCLPSHFHLAQHRLFLLQFAVTQ